MNGFTGIWVALATLARRLCDERASGLVVCGSTGEACALADHEQCAVLDKVIEAVPGCALTMGSGGSSQQAVIDRLRDRSPACH